MYTWKEEAVEAYRARARRQEVEERRIKDAAIAADREKLNGFLTSLGIWPASLDGAKRCDVSDWGAVTAAVDGVRFEVLPGGVISTRACPRCETGSIRSHVLKDAADLGGFLVREACDECLYPPEEEPD